MAVRADVSRLADGGMLTLQVDGEPVLLCRVRGELFAIAEHCSHARQSLSGGRLRGYQITCPLHGARFDLRDGRCVARPASLPVRSYAVVLDVDGKTAAISGI